MKHSLWHAPKLNYNQDDEISAEWNAKGMNLQKGAYLKVMMFGTEKVMSKVCEASQFGKQARHPFLAQTTHVSFKPLEMIHSDVWTTKTESIRACRFYLSFIDDHTKKVWVYFMKHEGEMFQHFLNFKAMVENEKGVNIKCLRFDGGGEYFSSEFSEYLKEHGIQRKYSCSYSPQ